MAKGILGKKLGMTQIFEADGRLIPVTVLSLIVSLVLWAPCIPVLAAV